jgi:hypothetical protein
MDVHERWRRASESADRFSRFRRRQPFLVGLMAATAATMTLIIFVAVAELDIGQVWGAALVTIVALMLAGYCIALLCNHRARAAYVAEYHRLNRTFP